MNLISAMRYLVSLSEHKHFGRAAQASHITQPALSNALRALESEFDVVIVKRDRNFEGFTQEGERVLAAAQSMLHEHANLLQELKSETHAPKGSVRMAAVPTAVPILARFSAMLQSSYPGVLPVVLSMSSTDIEHGLEDLSLDIALGYIERTSKRDYRVEALPQYNEHYFLLRRAVKNNGEGLKFGPKIRWAEAAKLPLCLLTSDMHNRSVVDAAFQKAGVVVGPVIETNSILTMALSVVAGNVCSIMPGALVGVVRNYKELEALPLVSPVVNTPVGFMTHSVVRPSRALAAAMSLAKDKEWLAHASIHSGLLNGR